MEDASTLITIKFSINQHLRDYVYEISTLYLLSRAIHLAVDVKLSEKINDTGIGLDELESLFPTYKKSALRDWLELLASYNIFSLKENKVFHTPLSEALKHMSPVTEKEWEKSYDMGEYFLDKPDYFNLFSKEINIQINDSNLSLSASSPITLLKELSSFYIVSRAVRYATSKGLFLQFTQDNDKYIDCIGLEKKLDIPETSLNVILKILERYNFLRIDVPSQSIHKTQFTDYLSSWHPLSYHNAMLMIDEKWWRAAAVLKQSLLQKSRSSFEAANQESFYDAYIGPNANPIFTPGMAEISLLEDSDVANAIRNKLEKYECFIDIAGGNGGLLKALFQVFGTSKRYILFEKDSNDPAQYKTLKHQNIEVVLGDFSSEKSNIPTIDNAIYLVKCVLHNIPEEVAIIQLLKNIKSAMGENCELIASERIVPEDEKKPHFNKISNFLMRLLFKSNSRNQSFYNTCFAKAGFNFVGTCNARNYVCMEGSPQKKDFTLTPAINLTLWETSKTSENPHDRLSKTQNIVKK